MMTTLLLLPPPLLLESPHSTAPLVLLLARTEQLVQAWLLAGLLLATQAASGRTVPLPA